MASKSYGHIAAIVVLVLIFFGLLILSTSNSSISVDYNFVDVIEINSYDDLGTVDLGTVKVVNNGLLSSRVDLDKYVICQISDYYGDNYYEVQYQGAKTVQGKAELFSYDYYQRRIDVSAGEEIELFMTVYPYAIQKYNIDQYDLYNVTLPFYLFKMEADDSVYNYCNSVRKEDALRTIYVKMNLEPKAVNDVPYDGIVVR